MIVSHKHKFIFIKTGKTTGTSIEIALSRFCGMMTSLPAFLREILGDAEREKIADIFSREIGLFGYEYQD